MAQMAEGPHIFMVSDSTSRILLVVMSRTIENVTAYMEPVYEPNLWSFLGCSRGIEKWAVHILLQGRFDPRSDPYVKHHVVVCETVDEGCHILAQAYRMARKTVRAAEAEEAEREEAAVQEAAAAAVGLRQRPRGDSG